MTKLFSWLVPTHYRAEKLALCLDRLKRQKLPDGWALEILIGHCEDDPQEHDDSRIRCFVTKSTYVGGRLTELLYRSRGSLVGVTGDDDQQDIHRTQAAIEAHESGSVMTGLSSFQFYDFDTGKRCVWHLKSGLDPLVVGASMTYTKELLTSIVGWPDTPRFIDGALRKRIFDHLGELPWSDCADACPDTIFGHGGGNITSIRPFPETGKLIDFGRYIVQGL